MEDRIGTAKYATLLASLLAMAVIIPLCEGTRLGATTSDVIGTALMVSGVWIASKRRRHLIILATLMVVIDAARLLPFSTELHAVVFAGVAGVLFFSYVAGIILADLLNETEVSVDTIGGAVCGYMTIGVAWGCLYFLIELVHRGSFNLPETNSPSFVSLQGNFLRLIYYSMVTLTTVGYGDITARIALTQNLSAIEAMMGQFYIATLVAQLVSLQVMRRRSR